MKTYRFSVARNPFTRGVFWDRQPELKEIYRHLQSDPPQSCALIGETYSGKTTLLRRLVDAREPFLPEENAIRKNYTFVYLDCMSYDDEDLAQKGAYASALFWWELYSEVYIKLQPAQHTKLPRPDFGPDGRYLESAFEIKFELEELIRSHTRSVVIVLDNFEGVASLPRRNSHWLRSLCQLACTLVAASRHLLYLTYQYDALDRQDYSPLWNLFSDPIYLGLMDKDEVSAFLQEARENAKKSASFWHQEDIGFIERMAGGHPELLRIVCMHLFDHRTQTQQNHEQGILEFNIARDARPICIQLWAGLNDAALRSELPLVHYQLKIEHENQELSPYQAALLDVVHGREVVETGAIFILEQRGLIEYREGGWQIFSTIMERFVLERESALNATLPASSEKSTHLAMLENQPLERYIPITERPKDIHSLQLDAGTQSDRAGEQMPIFTYLEGKVYDYLRSHMDQVCDREEIKLAVWPTNAPGNSALQKIIERIREKIEHEMENPPHLIAVRRRGYMLRYGVLENE